MPNTYSFDSPYANELLDIERRRKLADLLQQQAAQPLEANQMAGGYVVPISPLTGLTKLAQGIFAGRGQQDVNDQMRRLAETIRGDRRETVEKYLAAAKGRDEFIDPIGVSVPAQKGDLQAAYGILAQSRDPSLAALGLSKLTAGPLIVGENQRVLDPRNFAELVGPSAESKLGKLDQKDWTPESWAKFMAGRGADRTVLLPREEIISDNTGGALRFRTKYSTAPVASADISMRPGEEARLKWDIYQHENPSAAQRAQIANEGTGLGLRRAELFYNTGQAGMGGGATLPPRQPLPDYGGALPGATTPGPAAPPMALGRQAPAAVPGAAPAAPPQWRAAAGGVAASDGVTPKAKAEVAAERYKQQQGAKQILNSFRRDQKTGEDEISSLIKRSTSGGLENAISGAFGAITGSGTSGKTAIQNLAAFANQMTMDLMGGKLGTGISNADRDFVIGQLADIANPNTPANNRLGAWQAVVKRLELRAGGDASSGGASGNWGAGAPKFIGFEPRGE